MAVFCPHIAISSTCPNLALPIGFHPDDIDILIKATPDQRAMVINAGCVALRALLEQKDEISKGEAFKKGEASEKFRWQREKSSLVAGSNAKLKELENIVHHLKIENDTQRGEIAKSATELTIVRAQAKAQQESEQETIKNTRNRVVEEQASRLEWYSSELKKANEAKEESARQLALLSSTFRDTENKLRGKLETELKEKSSFYDKQLDEIKRMFQNDINKERETILSVSQNLDLTVAHIRDEQKRESSSEKTQLMEEIKKAQDLADQYLKECREFERKQSEANEKKFLEIRAAEDKVREECNKKYNELNENYRLLTNRQANSNIKGKDNEDAFAVLLEASFGTASDYKKLPKSNKYGDHVIKWEGLTLMFENKDYKETVPKAEVDKALRDFAENPECHVLIFVSENTDIANHQRAGCWDITHTVDGRPTIWIGKFGLTHDKISYLQMIGVVIRQLVRLQKQEKQLENNKDIIDHKKKIDDLRHYFQVTSNELKDLNKAQLEYQRAQNGAWKVFKNQICSVVNSFEDRLKYAMNDCDDFEADDVIDVDEVESDAGSSTLFNTNNRKTQKTTATTPKAKKTRDLKPALANNTMLNYFEKNPRGTTREQNGKDDLSGHGAEVNQNLPKQNLLS